MSISENKKWFEEQNNLDFQKTTIKLTSLLRTLKQSKLIQDEVYQEAFNDVQWLRKYYARSLDSIILGGKIESK